MYFCRLIFCAVKSDPICFAFVLSALVLCGKVIFGPQTFQALARQYPIPAQRCAIPARTWMIPLPLGQWLNGHASVFFTREKFFSPRENFQFSAGEVLKLPEKKSRKLPEKKKCSREKIAKICPRKKSGCPRKKCRIFPTEIQRIPKFLPEKNNIQPEKKS